MDICPSVLLNHLLEDTSLFLTSLEKFDLFCGRTVPRDTSTIESIACIRLNQSLLKKYQGAKKTDADSKAIEKFLAANASCQAYKAVSNDSSDHDRLLVGMFRKYFHDVFLDAMGNPVLSLNSITNGAGIGPGASVGSSGGDIYSKLMSGPLSLTKPILYRWYLAGLAGFQLELDAELYRIYAFGPYLQVQGNLLSCVPKTSEISRTICTEPLLNMFFQKGIGSVFERLLKWKFSIDLSTQQFFNRRLAQIGSEIDDYATIDLASASDTISLELLRSCMDSYSFGMLQKTRSEMVTLPNGDVIPLYMVSSMGNGFTFPLQTLLFASVVRAVYAVRGLAFVRNAPARVGAITIPTRTDVGNFGVYGDDIIVRREAYEDVCHLLELLGFTVNTSKSFGEGFFRESCGADFWHGKDVRGVYCTDLNTRQDVYSLINRLMVWSCNHGVLLSATIGYLAKHVRKLYVPSYDPEIAGLWAPFSVAVPMQRDRWTGSVLYERYVPNPKSIPMHDLASLLVKPKGWIFNPDGIILAAVRGDIRNGRIVQRQDFVRYSLRVAISPCWDWRDTHSRQFSDCGWRRFKATYALLNLCQVQSGATGA